MKGKLIGFIGDTSLFFFYFSSGGRDGYICRMVAKNVTHLEKSRPKLSSNIKFRKPSGEGCQALRLRPSGSFLE